jgi:glycopeptide antibiotics resistance protein
VPARRGWSIAAAGCTALILVATLSPEPEAVGIGCQWPWCLFDVAQNLVLFAPLGASLFLATRSHTKSIIAGAALSLAVELLQLHVIRGRDASLSDWISNTMGTAAGTGVAAAVDAILRRRR